MREGVFPSVRGDKRFVQLLDSLLSMKSKDLIRYGKCKRVFVSSRGVEKYLELRIVCRVHKGALPPDQFAGGQY